MPLLHAEIIKYISVMPIQRGSESEKDQRTSKKHQGINGKQQRKLSLLRSLSP